MTRFFASLVAGVCLMAVSCCSKEAVTPPSVEENVSVEEKQESILETAPEIQGKLHIDASDIAELGLTFEPVEMKVKGLKRDYNFLMICDLHVIAEDMSEAEEKSVHIIKDRMENVFKTSGNTTSTLALFRKLGPVVNNCGADAVLLGGDICDFGSIANLNILKDELSKWTVPYMYTRADHDFRPWWMAQEHEAEIAELGKAIDGDEDLMVMEFEDLLVVGYNKSTWNVTPDALKRFKEVYAKGKPIVIVSHVPFNSPVDPSFGEKIMSHENGRNLSWGKGCAYDANAVTDEFLQMVYAENSPVKLVLSGHMHYSADTMLSATCRQHMFAPAFTGNIGIVKLIAE
ncbi:MAG: metallophosphoesterase [Lentisphaeria bacterium]|nr:metallophosphoesterase [Lentisphaeria bacterium]